MAFSFWIESGSLLMFLAVAIGAFGAHGLKNVLSPEMKEVYETAVRYQVYHALALFMVAWMSSKFPSMVVSLSGWSFLVGVFLFSGSLYALSLSGVRALGIITPFGGLAFLAGWIFLFIAAYRINI